MIANRALKLWWILLAVKLVLSAWLPLVPDETYYWVWSHHPQLSYYDHPPMIAWWFWLGHAFEAWASAVRWPGVVLAHLAGLIWLRFFSDQFNEKQQLAWLMLWACTPLTGPGSLIMTPDLPLMLFWPLSLLAFHLWWRTPTLKYAFFLGATLGLGFLSKYVVVLMFPILAAAAVTEPEKRRMALRHIGAVVAGFLLLSLPVWLWNMRHDWISFRFQAAHGLGAKQWKPSWTVDYFLAQIGLLFPLVVYWALKARAPKLWHLAAWIPIVFFWITTFRGYAEANWPIVAHPLVLGLAVKHVYPSLQKLAWIAAFWLAAFALAVSQALWQWLPVDPAKLKTRELNQFEHLAQAAENYDPLFARSYQMASFLTYRLKRPVYKLPGMNRIDFYDFLATEPGSRYFLIREKTDPLPQKWQELGHKPVQQIPIDDRYEIVEIVTP